MNVSCRSLLLGIASAMVLAACGGGGGGSGSGGCGGDCAATNPSALSVADVQQVIAQAVFEAQARNAKATIAVVDRVGNVLGVFQMTGAPPDFVIDPQRPVTGGLNYFKSQLVTPNGAPLAAIAMAVTGAYLSSEGNAFSTRTASQIVQQHFDPGENNQPGGPLFGVQFSSLACSDITQPIVRSAVGPRPTPLGLSASPGGLPLYKNGTVVGGVGVMSNGEYTLDLDIQDTDTDPNELIAVAASFGFAAPAERQANQITVDGRTLRYVDSTSTASNPANAPPFSSVNGTLGTLVNVAGFGGSPIVAGVTFGQPASGYAPSTDPAFAGLNAYTLVDAVGNPRFPPRAGLALTRAEVVAILSSGLSVANRARAQIRRPLGSAAQVSVVVVDTNGDILGLIRSPDAPVFGTDVAVQKARSAVFFSSATAAVMLMALPNAMYNLIGGTPVAIGSYVTATQGFLSDSTALSNDIAYSDRAVGNLARPFFPDGIEGRANGPLSVPFATQWSPFNVGLQLDLVFNAIAAALITGPSAPPGCTANQIIRNGIQIFPGSVPIFRGSTLVGAVGVSGDGIDQDDMVAFLGLANAGAALNTGIANAPAALRADTIEPQGTGSRLRYVNCPQSPFNGSNEQNVCSGL
jgi:uncharacterized protein GlcG (DUF336 family)